MPLRIVCILAMLALGLGRLSAQELTGLGPSHTAGYPADVMASLRYAHDECKREGGKGTRFAAGTVRKLDLTGDGRADYIVDLRHAECVGRHDLYCGTAGCNIEILTARRSGKLRTVFSDRVREYEILPGNGARSVRFMMHGSYCGRAGNPSCEKTQRITGRTFVIDGPN
jgi:hypothetical protein